MSPHWHRIHLRHVPRSWVAAMLVIGGALWTGAAVRAWGTAPASAAFKPRDFDAVILRVHQSGSEHAGRTVLAVSAICVSDKACVAVVNGQPCRPGDVVFANRSSWRIADIAPSRVTVKRHDGERALDEGSQP